MPRVVTVCVLLFALTSPSAASRYHIQFLGVALDEETELADERLRDFLRAEVRGEDEVKFETKTMEYGLAIKRLTEWNTERDGLFMARLTPYVLVVSQMLGADIEVLATYRSRKTGEFTYSSYFVVHDRFGYASGDLDDFVRHLKSRPEPPRFIYHNRFSTSSYFLPSLYFRNERVFSLQPGDRMGPQFVRIRAERPPDVGTSSSELVRRVHRGDADFAAVWDGTKGKFDDAAAYPGLRFLRLPYRIPNDLLVISKAAGESLKRSIREAIERMAEDEIQVGDFLSWRDFNRTPDARKALAELVWVAQNRERPPPVVVKIESVDPGSGIRPAYLDAAAQAIRLSGTELVIYDEDFHKQSDVTWSLKSAHDNSIVIRSVFSHVDLEQQFRISFKRDDMASLTARIGSEITNKMHRIRYVWPFDEEEPTLLRDLVFDIPDGRRMVAQRIVWQDFAKNDYSAGISFPADVVRSNFHYFQLEGREFPRKSDRKFDFDPMSNVAYRVFLVREEERGLIYQLAAVALILLFSLAAGLALWAVARPQRGERALGGGTHRQAAAS